MSLIDWVILLGPLLLVVGAGIWSRRFVRGVADYLAAGRVCGRYVISVADVANALAVVTLVAQSEAYYKTGFAINFWNGTLIPLGMVMGLTGYCFYRYRETRALSIGQFLEMRYNRSLRIFASVLRTFSETLCNMIVPAVSARFFIYLLGLPHKTAVFGWEVSTFALVILLVLTLALIIIWYGGTIALIITDAFQSILSYPIFAVFVIFVLVNFSWFDEIVPVMANRAEGESFLNPYDIESLRDFNLFALLVTVMNSVLNRASWIGGGATMAGRTPHEQKMAGILGSFRNGFSLIFYFLIGVMVITLLNHANFSGPAGEIRVAISSRVAEEITVDSGLRTNLVKATRKVAQQPPAIVPGKPLLQTENPDTPYLDASRNVLGKEANGNALFQQFRTLYYQLMLPVTMRHMLPAGLMGLFALLMVMLMISTDDSRIFSGAMTIVQDTVLPFLKKPLSPQRHILLVRFAAIGIGIVFFTGSFFMSQLDYINLFTIITTSIWLGGAGPVMIGGLYSRFGTTTGAFASLITGTVISGGGILLQRNWADRIYPFLERNGWSQGVGALLENLSAPLSPFVVWQMNPVKFPVNSNEIFFLSMLGGIAAYCLGSWLTCREPFNLDRMLHRGEYGDGTALPNRPGRGVRHIFGRLIGIDAQYTAGDKIIAWSVFAYSFVYCFLFAFIGVIAWNAISPWPLEWWGYYFLIYNLCVPCVIAVISTFWFMIGGIIDLRRMFRDLAARKDNPLDDGRVEGHVSLADRETETERER